MLGRDVAIKAPSWTLSAHHVAKPRFLREAWAAAVINHPHVVTSHSVDRHAGVPSTGLGGLASRHLNVINRTRPEGPDGIPRTGLPARPTPPARPVWSRGFAVRRS
jgi:hypothetical protein